MSFTRYASFESSEVLEIKGAPTRQVTASLDKLGEYDNYRTDDGYMYVRIRAISSRVNKNHDGWPSIELAGSPEIFERHSKQSSTGFTVEASEGDKEWGFATFIGKPIFVDHHNSDPKKARGVIVDSKLKVLPKEKVSAMDSYYSSSDADPEHLPPTEIELLLEVDAKSYPKLAKAIKSGDIDGFSMGCDVEKSKCSHCGHIATSPEEYCSHIQMKGAEHDFKTADGKRTSRKSYENCYGIKFFEISAVFDPADPTALAREIRAGVNHESIMDNNLQDPVRPDEQTMGIEQEALELTQRHPEITMQNAIDILQRKNAQPMPGAGEGESPEVKRWDYTKLPGPMPPAKGPIAEQGLEGNPLGNFAEEAFEEKWPGGQGRPVRNDPRWSSVHVAENPLPQSFETTAPEKIDTMRQEQICPVCGEQMDKEECAVCGYVKPPKGFDNPDLNKAKEIDQEMQQHAEEPGAPEEQEGIPPQAGPQPGGQQPKQEGSYLQQKTRNPVATASVMSDMRWQPQLDPRIAAKINQNERPIKQTNKPASNEPATETVISNPTAPVTSAMRTAQELIEAAQQNHTGDTMSTRTADGPTAPDASPDTRADVTGVGGVMETSNEDASKADAQTDVMGIGGTGVEGVEADKTETLPTASKDGDDAGFNSDKTTQDSGPTATYPDSDGTEKGFTDPVTNEVFVGQGGEQGTWSSTHTAYDAKPFYDQPGLSGGSANQGTQPVDPVGKAQDRVDVLKAVTTPENNSGATKTWSGTDGNSIYRQQDPVTPDLQKNTDSAWTSHIVTAMKLADTEVDLGMIAKDDKYSRIAELESQSDEVLTARLETLATVKTTATKLASQQRMAGVTRLPGAFGKATAAPNGFDRVSTGLESKEASTEVDDDVLDSALFGR